MHQDEQLALEILKDTARSPVERIKAATKLDLDFWKNRTDKPNLSREDFINILPYIPTGAVCKWKERESSSGPHCEKGEDQVFVIEFKIRRRDQETHFYLKGYFFDKGNLRGVCIQSFRKTKTERIGKLKLV